MESEDLPTTTAKRNFEGVEIQVKEEQKALCEKYKFDDFDLDTSNIWIFSSLISCNADNPDQIDGFLFSHIETLLPMVILRAPTLSEYHVAAFERVIDAEIQVEGQPEVPSDFLFLEVVSGENIREQMNELLREIESHYSEQMGPMDANLVEFANADVLYFIRTGDPSGDPAVSPEQRKIVKAKRANSDKM